MSNHPDELPAPELSDVTICTECDEEIGYHDDYLTWVLVEAPNTLGCSTMSGYEGHRPLLQPLRYSIYN